VLEHFPTDLRSWLDSEPQYDESAVIKITYNLICALNFLESANIMHRDIKPANILIDPESLDIKICDFGLSRSDP
jgi:mitogen-activated protein kinase 1/3